jgi:TRAP transporter TAXI family solute receptor
VPDVDVSVVETGASVDNMKRMQKGTLDIGLVSVEQPYLGWKGMENWKDTPFPDIRIIWVYTFSGNYVIVREETGIKSLRDLAGKKFNPGIRGSATEKMTETVLVDLGIKPEWQRMGTSDAVDAMKDKRIVGYAKSGNGFALDASTMDIATQTAVRVLPFTEEEMKKSKAAHPYLPWIKVPPGAIKGMGEFWAPAIITGFSASKSLSNETVYQIVKAVSEGVEYQKAAFKGTADDIPRLTVEAAQSPLHAGTIKYLREKGIKIPDHLIPAEAR